jgi:ketose-bisphosphate aldolase
VIQERGRLLPAAARRDGWAVAAFSIYNLEQALGVARGAEAERRPVLLQAGASAFRYAGREPLASLALAVAEGSTAPIGVHLDHSRDLDEVRACLRLGYGSVMFDGSHLSLDDNIASTRRVAAEAHAAGAWVEAELAGIAGDEDRSGGAVGASRTDPALAEQFVEETGIDALAVAIGNVHGIPLEPVALDLELLSQISARVPVPLVLHGASGLADDQVTAAIDLGVAKINVNAELRRAYREALLQVAADPPAGDDLESLLRPAGRAVELAARRKIRLYARGRPRPNGTV